MVLILRYDQKLGGIAYNQHCHGLDVKGELPWRQIKKGWNDADLAGLKVYVNQVYGLWSPAKLKEALVAVVAERAYYPIRDYLGQLPAWDGVKRIDTLLIDYLGAVDNVYTRAVMRKTLIAAVARVYEPGTKFDTILIFNGPQGIGKSTFFAKLGKEWFSDSLTLTDMRDKTAAEKLQGYWLLEIGEMAGIRKTEVETVKSFVTRTDDKYRASYGAYVEEHPRQCVIVGTTNSEGGFLRDITGNRCFWPVRVTGEGAQSVWEMQAIDQIWAEALAGYEAGETLFLTGEERELACCEQSEAMENDDREGLVREYLEKKLPEQWAKMDLYERRSFLSHDTLGSGLQGVVRRQVVCTMEIWCECFGKDAADMRKMDSYEISAILAKIEVWLPYTGNKTGTMRLPIYNKQRIFVRTEEATSRVD